MRSSEVSIGKVVASATDGNELKQLTEWVKEPTVLDLKDDLSACKSSHDVHSANVQRWNSIRNVTASSKPKKVKNRSQVQPKLVRRQNEWRYSALSEPFLSTEKLYDVNPRTWEDERAAAQNELVLNWQFDTKLNKISFIDSYVRTAVDEGSVVVRVGWERNVESKTVTAPVWDYLEVSSEEDVNTLKEALDLRDSNPRGFLDIPEELQEAVAYFEESGVPVLVQQSVDEFGLPMTEEVQEEIVHVNKPTVGIVDYENIYIDPSCEGDVEKAKFVVLSYETTKADLKKDGRYSNLNVVNWSGNKVLAQPDHATETPDDFSLKDDLRSPVVVYEYWGLYDVEGNEELTPIVASWIGDVMIRMEENPFPDKKPPFIVVPYMPVKKSVYGEPDAELLEDNQTILGATMRGMIDLLGRSSNSQTGTAKGFLDVTNKRRYEAGGDYEFNPGNGDPRLAVYQHTYPEIPNSALTMTQMQNQEAEAMSGVKSFSGGLSGDAYGEVAKGIGGMMDAAAKREMNILRRLAKGINDIGIKIAAMNAVFLSEKETIRVTNKKFVTIKREDLVGKFDLKVDINTSEVDETKAKDLGFMLQTMGPDMDPSMSRMILADIARLKRMPVLANKIENYEPEPDPMMEKAKELEIAKLEMEIEEMKAQVLERKARANKLQAEADNEELEFVEQESGTSHSRDMQRTQSQAQANQDLEVTKSLLKPQKAEETRPEIEAAVGYNALTEGQQQNPPQGY
jgi:hypothetical protein